MYCIAPHVTCRIPSQLTILSDGYSSDEIIFVWNTEKIADEMDSTIKLPEHEIKNLETRNCTAIYGTTGMYGN